MYLSNKMALQMLKDQQKQENIQKKKDEKITNKVKKIEIIMKQNNRSFQEKRKVFNLGEDTYNDIKYYIDLSKPILTNTDQISTGEIIQKNMQLEDNFMKKQQTIQKFLNKNRRFSCHCQNCGKIQKKDQNYINMKDLQLLIQKTKKFDKQFIKLKSKQNQLIQQQLNLQQKIKNDMSQTRIFKQELKPILNKKALPLTKQIKIATKNIYSDRQNKITNLYSEKNLQQLTKKINQLDLEPNLQDLGNLQQNKIYNLNNQNKQKVQETLLLLIHQINNKCIVNKTQDKRNLYLLQSTQESEKVITKNKIYNIYTRLPKI